MNRQSVLQQLGRIVSGVTARKINGKTQAQRINGKSQKGGSSFCACCHDVMKEKKKKNPRSESIEAMFW